MSEDPQDPFDDLVVPDHILDQIEDPEIRRGAELLARELGRSGLDASALLAQANFSDTMRAISALDETRRTVTFLRVVIEFQRIRLSPAEFDAWFRGGT